MFYLIKKIFIFLFLFLFLFWIFLVIPIKEKTFFNIYDKRKKINYEICCLNVKFFHESSIIKKLLPLCNSISSDKCLYNLNNNLSESQSIEWKKFFVPQINLEFEYSDFNKNYFLLCGLDNNFPLFEFDILTIRPGEPCDCGFDIRWFDNQKNLSIVDFWIEKRKKEFPSDWRVIKNIKCDENFCILSYYDFYEKEVFNDIYKLEKLFIDNKIAINFKIIEENFSIGRDSDGIYLKSNNGKIIQIMMCEDELNNKILSTFKFID